MQTSTATQQQAPPASKQLQQGMVLGQRRALCNCGQLALQHADIVLQPSGTQLLQASSNRDAQVVSLAVCNGPVARRSAAWQASSPKPQHVTVNSKG
jgi:hypothetical protein